MKTIFQVDAFTTKPFTGNPACVVIADEHTPADWMQNVAAEMNVSETAFVVPGRKGFSIRWFTPKAEVKLCGHATLSAAHIMYEAGFVKPGDEIVFGSISGDLKVKKMGSWLTMDFPTYPLIPVEVPRDFEKITGIKPVELYSSINGWVLAFLNSEYQVRRARPDFGAMRHSEMGHLMITAPSSETNFDFCVRCFAPSIGIDEDPVTGSAHCALVPFWHRKTGNTEFISHQVSERSGILKVALAGDRVLISGQAVTVFKAELLF
ncbi:MAG: PhzF family phenazine biosynthesis protein [Bacteroidales bacterium]|jgi:PhzF family phenazine biosynthesis protein|nr:PhzF family phenazine biosynthesis protein [Bacteroidales bacterium]